MIFKLLSIGVQKDFSRTRKFRIRMINAIAYMIIFLSVMHTVFHLIANDGWLISLFQLFYSVLALLCLLLNHFKRYFATEFVLHIFFPVWIVVVSVLLGKTYQMELYLIINIIGAIFIFTNKLVRYYYGGLSFLLLIGVRIYFIYHPEGLIEISDNILGWMYVIHAAFPLMILSVLAENTLNNNVRLYDKLQAITKNQEKIIEERTQEVKEKSQAIERSNEELKRFSYISAHDLREPLRNIMSFSQLLKRDLKQRKLDNIEEYLDFITSGISRIDSITKDIVSYTELEDYIHKVDIVDTDFIVHKIINEIKENGKALILTTENPPKVAMNGQLCHLLFSNIIQNAIQYCDKSMPNITITAIPKGEMFQISIKDNGKGISKEYFETIFEMFKRLHNDIDKSGSGIGLAICKKIVNAYGGKIWVNSHLGVGSTFYFTLPKARNS